MRIAVSQIYIEAGVNYPFTHIFQKYISKELSIIVASSPEFDQKFPDFTLVINMSAKSDLAGFFVKGPSVYKKTKDVEFSVFLPYFKHDPSDPGSLHEALTLFLEAVASVLETLGSDISELRFRAASIIEHILANPEMIKSR